MQVMWNNIGGLYTALKLFEHIFIVRGSFWMVHRSYYDLWNIIMFAIWNHIIGENPAKSLFDHNYWNKIIYRTCKGLLHELCDMQCSFSIINKWLPRTVVSRSPLAYRVATLSLIGVSTMLFFILWWWYFSRRCANTLVV